MSWKCDECGRTLIHANQWHCCFNQEIDNLFLNKPTELLYAFDKVLCAVANFDDVEISATKNCIVFFKRQTFLVVKPMKQVLDIKFYLKEPFYGANIYKVALYGKQHEHHIRISHAEQIDDAVLKYFKASYQLFNNQ
ncbi:MAG: hypothetical protein EAZ47_10700 [Bacteroidetes bacterium]|nr:MAG: hypothetical protein EAY72_08065 [Bacteroidota bacterium]TAE58635.1 MAG: hypothetical protein EAY68_11320 [Bacteroidota bacterium]TAF90823.1 MAG: hypothetical protein EAZ47_10700 [Bacteroidota bacterium]